MDNEGMRTVFRIQDTEGRGPYRPGFSKQWVEERDDLESLPSWMDEFGPVHEKILFGEYAGTGCLTLNQLRRWFTKGEYQKLKNFGYQAVSMPVNRLLAYSTIQCVFGRAKPLTEDFQVITLY